MEKTCIYHLQEEENQWFQHSYTARNKFHQLAIRAHRLINQADDYSTTIDTNLETLHNETLEIQLQYLSKIKALTAFITNAHAMLKMLSSHGPVEATHI